ncbi:asparagine synthase (glutamine-hydrolyzing) [Sphingomonas asaccharolytica]|uniref:asparagine synthase (glutamine-hydrolyzing) n=1 Tax=Sphingomonas asaccharolytica TaxID=40681 RepID=UPI00082A4AC5|nr:asparagine synthase (glutamine-hydrolyzing) [Sphingomonas asaccharolytica]
MCGIAGYYCYDSAATTPVPGVLAAIRDHMAARGPDGMGFWENNERRVALAHRRLSIIDLDERANQPMHRLGTGLSIVFNGEIYNYRELKAELEARGHLFKTSSDTEVLLALYIEHGDALVDRLRGMFAFALWDAGQQRLLFGRDPYGIKPLYYADIGGCIRFASQVRALCTDPTVPKTPSPAGLVGFHLLGSVPEPFTIYKAIRAVPAGHVMSIDCNGVGKPRRFANIARVIADARTETADPEVIRGALRDSVRAHLVADVEVGAFLSGGVDSGALIGLMRDCGQERIRTVTLQFPEFDGNKRDETARARQVAELYDVDFNVRRVERAEFEADLPAIFAAMDQPSIDGVNSWFVSKAIGEQGLKVAISGLGGDELLAGYSTFRTVPALYRRAGPFARLPGMGPLSSAFIAAVMPRLADRNPKARGVLSLADSWAGSWLLRRALLLPFELDGVLDSTTAAEGMAELDALALINAELVPDPGSDNGRVAALESGLYMKNQLLRDIDWASMAHSIEVRVPLVDYTLLRAVAPLIPRLRPGQGKAMLANAPSAPLPDAIVNHAKTGFNIPVTAWLQGRGTASPDRRDSRAWSRAVIDRFLALEHAATRDAA